MIWPFGKKYRNKHIKDIPTHYLEWVLSDWKDLRPHTRSAIQQELQTRAFPPLYKQAGKENNETESSELKTLRNEVLHLKSKCQNLSNANDYLRIENRELNLLNNRLTDEAIRLKFIRDVHQNTGNGPNGKAQRIFRELALKWHPDRGGSDLAMKAINEFYDKLKN